jgi:hypothetical protein
MHIQSWTNPSGGGPYTAPPKDLDAGDVSIVVKKVKNPAGASVGMGNFGIKTFSNSIILVDENINFGFFALAPSYGSFASVEFLNDGSKMAGYTTNYVVSFQNTANIKAKSWFRLTFPSGYKFHKKIDCYIMQMNTVLSCTAIGQVIVVKGLTVDLPVKPTAPKAYKIKMKNVINPFSVGNIKGFKWESLVLNT